MRYLKLATLSIVLSFSFFTHANIINDMQSCQALNQFIINKLKSGDSPYSTDRIDTVVSGLASYNAFIQSDIVMPGLLAFSDGDIDQANEMQEQVDSYKAELESSFELRYPSNEMVTDFATTINNCAKKAVPTGDALASLQLSLSTLLAMAQGK